MNLRSELLEVFGPEVGHALSISSWDRLEEWVKRKLAEAQAETVERCVQKIHELAQKQKMPDSTTCIPELRALLPDPHARERWERTAYIEGVKSVYVQHDHAIAGVCGAACPLKLRDLRVAELERQLGALSGVTLQGNQAVNSRRGGPRFLGVCQGSRGEKMSNEGFGTWHREFVRDKGRNPLDWEIWQAAEVHLRQRVFDGLEKGDASGFGNITEIDRFWAAVWSREKMASDLSQ